MFLTVFRYLVLYHHGSYVLRRGKTFIILSTFMLAVHQCFNILCALFQGKKRSNPVELNTGNVWQRENKQK